MKANAIVRTFMLSPELKEGFYHQGEFKDHPFHVPELAQEYYNEIKDNKEDIMLLVRVGDDYKVIESNIKRQW